MYDHRVISSPNFILNGKGTLQQQHDQASLIESSIWGNTCDGIDCITKSVMLPTCEIGSWFVFENMGAYTTAAASKFNGFPITKTLYLNSTA